MGANLITSLQEIRDFRASRGRRYPLWLILLLIVMGTISGCLSYYAPFRLWGATLQGSQRATRIRSNSLAIGYYFSSHLTLPLDFQTLAIQFEQWVNNTFTLETGEWVAIEGKSIKGTVTEPGTAYQNFVSLVSVYSHQQGVVLAAQQFESKNSSELKVVQTILKALQLEGVVFTMDALHCQNKLLSCSLRAATITLSPSKVINLDY